MGQVLEGRVTATAGQRFALVVSRFNDFFTKPLLEGALATLRRHGAADEAIDVVWVPGSFEIPVVAKRIAGSGAYAAVICLGAVIRGATSHFDYVAGQAAAGVARAALDTGVPVIFGIITTDDLDQAIDRSGAKAGNKGSEAAVTAIEMASLMAQLPAPRPVGAAPAGFIASADNGPLHDGGTRHVPAASKPRGHTGTRRPSVARVS